MSGRTLAPAPAFPATTCSVIGLMFLPSRAPTPAGCTTGSSPPLARSSSVSTAVNSSLGT